MNDNSNEASQSINKGGRPSNPDRKQILAEKLAIANLLNPLKQNPDVIYAANLLQKEKLLLREQVDQLQNIVKDQIGKLENTVKDQIKEKLTFEQRILELENEIINLDKFKSLREDDTKLKRKKDSLNRLLESKLTTANKNLKIALKALPKKRELTRYEELCHSGQYKRQALVIDFIQKINGGAENKNQLVDDLCKRLTDDHSIKLTIEEAALFWIQLSLSFHNYRLIKKILKGLGFDILPDVRKVNLFKKGIQKGRVSYSLVAIKNADGETINFISHAEVENIQEILSDRINKLFENNALDLVNDEVKICLVGDKGSTTTKLGILIKCVNDKKLTNGINNITLISLMYGSDTYLNMSHCYKDIAKQLESFTMIELSPNNFYPISLHLTGDYTFLCAVIGHKDPNCSFPCIKCISKTKVHRKCWESHKE